MPTKRKFTATFPTAKVKKIMQLDEEIGKISATVPSVVSCGVESLVKQLVTESYEIASNRNSRTVSASHVKQVVENHPEFSFLSALIAEIPNLKAVNPSAPNTVAALLAANINNPDEHSHSPNSSDSRAGLDLTNKTNLSNNTLPTKKPRGRPRKNNQDSNGESSKSQKREKSKQENIPTIEEDKIYHMSKSKILKSNENTTKSEDNINEKSLQLHNHIQQNDSETFDTATTSTIAQ